MQGPTQFVSNPQLTVVRVSRPPQFAFLVLAAAALSAAL